MFKQNNLPSPVNLHYLLVNHRVAGNYPASVTISEWIFFSLLGRREQRLEIKTESIRTVRCLVPGLKTNLKFNQQVNGLSFSPLH
jgi:hypothetical protein